MSDQENLVESPELVVLKSLIQSIQEDEQPQRDQDGSQITPHAGNYDLDSTNRVSYKRLLPADEVVGNGQMFKDLWSIISSFLKSFVFLGVAAVILGVLIGVITPWLTTIF